MFNFNFNFQTGIPPGLRGGEEVREPGLHTVAAGFAFSGRGRALHVEHRAEDHDWRAEEVLASAVVLHAVARLVERPAALPAAAAARAGGLLQRDAASRVAPGLKDPVAE